MALVSSSAAVVPWPYVEPGIVDPIFFMTQLFILRVLLKLKWWFRQMVVRHPRAVASTFGFDGVVRMLETVGGGDAIQLLRCSGAEIGVGTRVVAGLAVRNAEGSFAHLHIGERCHIGAQVFLDLAGPVDIGDRVTISMRVTVLTHTDVGDSRCGLPTSMAGVRIDDDAYLGAGAMVLPGVRIGAGAVVAAGALVNGDVAPRTIVAGVPARVIKGGSGSMHPAGLGQ